MSSSIDRLEGKIERLEKEVTRIKKLYNKTLFYQATDPEVSLSQARKSAEAICKQIYIKSNLEKDGKPANKLMLNELIQILIRHNLLPQFIVINLNTIQQFGNFGVHDQGHEDEIITEEYVKPCLTALGTVFNWYVKTYYEVDGESLKDLFNDTTKASSAAQNDIQVQGKEACEAIKVVGNHAPPYRIFGKDGATGIYFDIMRAAANKINTKLEFIEKPFKRALQMVKSGEADIMVGPNKTSEREEYMRYSSFALPAEKKAFYVSVGSEPILNYEDLYNRILIVGRGKFYSERINSDPNIVRVEVSDYLSGIKMVNDSHKYVIVMPYKEGEYLLEENDIDLLTSPFPIEGKPSYITFSKESKCSSEFDALERALEEIINEGTYEKIMRLY